MRLPYKIDGCSGWECQNALSFIRRTKTGVLYGSGRSVQYFKDFRIALLYPAWDNECIPAQRVSGISKLLSGAEDARTGGHPFADPGSLAARLFLI